MCKITSITRQVKNKNRVSIHVDGSYFGALDEKTFLSSGLKTGDTLSEDIWERLFAQAENEAAFNKALGYISRLMRSKKQMIEYLNKKGYEAQSIQYAIDKLKEYKYIDDESYARMILSHQVNVKHAGMMAVKNAMYKNGIDKQTSEKAILEYDNEKQRENAKICAEKLLKKYHRIQDRREKKHKISQAMMRRGYNWDMINSVLRGDDEEN
ncbi:MAG: RecX family transcriptional regulator [Clostridiales bacterium]|nr:RecX family transcriptional regulator [Clostridiales bacterium]